MVLKGCCTKWLGPCSLEVHSCVQMIENTWKNSAPVHEHIWLNPKRNSTCHRDRRILWPGMVEKALWVREDIGWALNTSRRKGRHGITLPGRRHSQCWLRIAWCTWQKGSPHITRKDGLHIRESGRHNVTDIRDSPVLDYQTSHRDWIYL